MSASKKILLLLAAFGLILSPGIAVAVSGLDVHSIDNTTDGKAREGACAVCHNVSATAATRGWGRSITDCTTGWFNQKITVLCWTCHSSTGIANDMTDNAMNVAAHKWVVAGDVAASNNPSARETANIQATNLPYVAGTNLECTSCHNVHNNASEPFLMKGSIEATCAACHPNRIGARAVHAENIADNVSTHPVGINFDNTVGGTTAPARIKSLANANGGFKHPLRKASDNSWNLGGKLDNGANGNFTCQTCHSVHQNTGNEDLLEIYNGHTNAEDNNALCEGCHYGGQAGQFVGVNGDDHPLDRNSGRWGFYPTGVAMPSDWTGRFDTASVFWDNGAYDTPKCGSCHDTHGGISGKSLLRWPIPAAANGEWCFSCHTDSQVIPAKHHSTTQTDDPSGGFTSSVSCAGCHGATVSSWGAEWSAHNGFGQFAVGPDLADGSSADNAATFYGAAANTRTFERLCESCHNPVNPTNFPRAIAGRFDNTNVILPNSHGNPTGALTHLSSDFTAGVFIQDTNRTANTYLRIRASGTDNSWDTGGLNMSKYSNYGTGTPQNPQTPVNGAYMICESCHNLLTNAGSGTGVQSGWKQNLLLYSYMDDGYGTPGSYTSLGASSAPVAASRTSQPAVLDGFCRGCHSSTLLTSTQLGSLPANDCATYVHYPAAHTMVGFQYAAGYTPYGRSTATIRTAAGACPDNTTADASIAPGVFSYPAANTVNCDSCHRPHNAENLSTNGMAWNNTNAPNLRHWILEPGSVQTDNLAKTEACAQCHNTNIMCAY